MKLTAAQTQAMPFLVSGLRQKDVAEKVGVTPQTVSTWMNDAEFVAYLNQARSDALDNARDMLRGLANEAVEELRSIILSSENDEVRRKAIIDVLDMIGIRNPSQGLYGWGIGPKDAGQVEKKWKQEANPELFKLLGMSF